MGQLRAKLRLHAAMLNICLTSSDVLLLYPRSRARRCRPNQSCSNIWNTASFHWSIFAPSLKSQDSPVNFLKWAFFIFFNSCESERGWTEIYLSEEFLLWAVEESQGHKFWFIISHLEYFSFWVTRVNIFMWKKKKSQMQMPSNLKRKKRFLTKKLEDCSNTLTDMHQITDMH